MYKISLPLWRQKYKSGTWFHSFLPLKEGSVQRRGAAGSAAEEAAPTRAASSHIALDNKLNQLKHEPSPGGLEEPGAQGRMGRSRGSCPQNPSFWKGLSTSECFTSSPPARARGSREAGAGWAWRHLWKRFPTQLCGALPSNATSDLAPASSPRQNMCKISRRERGAIHPAPPGPSHQARGARGCSPSSCEEAKAGKKQTQEAQTQHTQTLFCRSRKKQNVWQYTRSQVNGSSFVPEYP